MEGVRGFRGRVSSTMTCIRWQWDSGAPPRKIGRNLRWCSVNEAPQHLTVNARATREIEREKGDTRRKPEMPLGTALFELMW